MRMTRWYLVSVLATSLLSTGCNMAGTSGQEDLGRGIVRGTRGAQLAGDAHLPVPAHTDSFKGQVTAVEGGAYVLREANGIERRVGHDQNTRIDRPAHVGDQVEVFMDDRDRAVLIRNIDEDGRLQ